MFLHYYLDVGNTQAAHGRAPAVALGHKLANPDSIVVSYQGDGDLASIGLAEILQAAQLGLPLTVIFVNNAVYGMTGGQMAPTTLMGQETTTSPGGRGLLMGQPLRMAEMIAGLDGPIYVERVALFDAKQRVKAQKAIHKALRLQVENRGLAFVEVLAECPTHLKMTPQETERWVKEKMLPVFPLGVKKDGPGRDWSPDLRHPQCDAETLLRVIGGNQDPAKRFSTGFPEALYGPDIALKLAGAGGDGAQTAAMLITRAAINEGFDATHIPSYGPESRGGTSYADVHIAESEVLAPAARIRTCSWPSTHRAWPGSDPRSCPAEPWSTTARSSPSRRSSTPRSGVGYPAPRSPDLGKPMVKNIVALGALQAATQIFPEETLLTAIRRSPGTSARSSRSTRPHSRGREGVRAAA